MQQQNPAKRATIILGVLLAIVMVGSVFAPLLSQQSTTSNEPTSLAPSTVPTFPPPPSDLSAIKFDKVYLHPSGIFTIGQPDGWNATDPNKGPNIAQVNLVNNSVQSVVDSYIEAVSTPITPADLSAQFNEAAINASWARFNQWEETSRKMEGDRLVIDFNVTLSSRTYIARQIAWTDGNWIYTVRVLVPENAVDFLKYLLNNFVSSLQVQSEFKGMPLDWSAYYDPDNHHIIRYPATWTLADSAPGRPTSITGSGGQQLRIEARANTPIADEAAARTFVENLRSGNKVVSVKPITRLLGKGFAVAYSYATVDGSQQSGLVDLLNSDDGTLHIADLRFPMSGIDLNNIDLNPAPAAAATAEATAQATAQATAEATAPVVDPAVKDLAEVMGSFYVIQPINLSQQSMPPTPTPIPTLVVTNEVTAEASAAVGAPTATPVTTEAATVEATVAPAMTEAATQAATAGATTPATAEVTAAATSGS